MAEGFFIVRPVLFWKSSYHTYECLSHFCRGKLALGVRRTSAETFLHLFCQNIFVPPDFAVAKPT